MTTNNQFFEVRLNIFAGTTNRKALDKKTLKQMGFNDADIEEVKAVLSTTVLPKGTFDKPLAIKRYVQDWLATKGHNHPLVGRIFNPKDRVEIVEFLREKKAEYETWAQGFLLNYEQYKQEQLTKVQNSAKLKGYDPVVFVDAVAKAQPSRKYYESKLAFDFLDLGIELDSEEWSELIDKINSDLVEKTIYELAKDASEIRDKEIARTRAKSLEALAKKLESLDFYIKSTKSLADKIQQTLKHACGGVKPTAEYSPAESLALSGVAKILEHNARSLVNQEADFNTLFDKEGARIQALIAQEDDNQSTLIEDSERQEELVPDVVPETIDETASEPNEEPAKEEPAKEEPSVKTEKPSSFANAGLFDF